MASDLDFGPISTQLVHSFAFLCWFCIHSMTRLNDYTVVHDFRPPSHALISLLMQCCLVVAAAALLANSSVSGESIRSRRPLGFGAGGISTEYPMGS